MQQPFHVICKPIGPLCNLSCDYCFYLEKAKLFPETRGNDFRMSDEVLENFVSQYIASQPEQTREINFAWQGGEPTLMGIDFFRKVRRLQRKYQRKGVKITNALQTNGVLLDQQWAEFLRDEQFLVGISIDGPQPLHDRFRKTREGKGSFSQVMKGLEALKRGGVDFNTMTVIQSDNGKYPLEVYNFLKEIGSTFMQFIPIVERNDEGGVTERTVGALQWGKFLTSVFNEWLKQDIGKYYVQHFDLMLGLYLGYPSSLCVHASTCGRAVALEHDGSLYSCDHFVFEEYYLGSIKEQGLADLLDSPQQQDFGNTKLTELPSDCRECQFLQLCYGGCPAQRVKKTAQGEPGLNWLCEGYKYFYESTAPVFQAMSKALKTGLTADQYQRFLPGADNTDRKVGRNDPCPCGSGKKFKHCHGR